MEESRTIDTVLTAAIAAVAVALCTLVTELLYLCGIDVPYLCFLAVIVACCALGGWALSAWALIFSTVGIWGFFARLTHHGWPKHGDAAHLIFFIAVSYFVCWIIDGQRRANNALTRDNVALGCKVSTLLRRAKAR